MLVFVDALAYASASASVTVVAEFFERSPARKIKSDFSNEVFKSGDFAKEPVGVEGRKVRFGKFGS